MIVQPSPAHNNTRYATPFVFPNRVGVAELFTPFSEETGGKNRFGPVSKEVHPFRKQTLLPTIHAPSGFIIICYINIIIHSNLPIIHVNVVIVSDSGS